VVISPGEEKPFQSGLVAGAEAVMPGHLLVAGGQWPATLDKSFLDSTRHHLATAGTSFLLIADDVSMGALRQPMNRLGVTAPDDADQGMVEVADLSWGWFEQLAAAGCDLFLIRGLPVGALPCAGEISPVPPLMTLDLLPEVPFDDKPYLAAGGDCSPLFAAKAENLAFLDLARVDRWQVAGGLAADHWARWDEIWAERFGAVSRASGLTEHFSGEEKFSWLLVTSHRPMALNWVDSSWASDLQDRLTTTGRCLLMGHPSLHDEFVSFLPAEWQVTSKYDVSCDLIGSLSGDS